LIGRFFFHDEEKFHLQLIKNGMPNGWGIRCGGMALVLFCSNTVFYTAVACMPLLDISLIFTGADDIEGTNHQSREDGNTTLETRWQQTQLAALSE
jgi:hypothetical protein